MKGTGYSTEVFFDDEELEKRSMKLTTDEACIEDHFKDGSKLFFHQRHRIGSEKLDIDLITVTHMENGSVRTLDIGNDATIRLEDESEDTCYGVSIEYCEINTITRVSRILLNEQILDGVSTSYRDDGSVQKIEIYDNGRLVQTILDD